MESAPFRILGLDHLVLRVRDAERMTAFYCEVLGCSIERERADIGLTQLRAGRALIDLVDVDGVIGRMGGTAPDRQGRNLDHFCLTVEGYDEARIRAHLAQYDIDAGESVRRFGAEGEGPSIYLRDPEGNTIELKQARPAS